MTRLRLLQAVLVLAGLLGSVAVPAQIANPIQDQPEPAAATEPELAELSPEWWAYFEEAPADDVATRIDGFLAGLDEELADLEPQNLQTGQRLLDAVRDNFGIYRALPDSSETQANDLPEPFASYSLHAVLEIAAIAREAAATAAAEEREVEREQRILDGASQRRDALFKDYLDANAGDGRWLAALRLIGARIAQEIAQRRTDYLSRRYENANRFADATADRLALAQERITTDADPAALAELVAAVDAAATAVAEAEERRREAQLEASGLDLDTAESRSEQRLQQQRLLVAEARVAEARAALALAEAERWWTALQLEADADAGQIGDARIAWSEMLRELEQQLVSWQRQTENELLAVQSIDRDELDRIERRLLDQRLGTAQQTLTRIGAVNAAAADLDILITLVDTELVEQSGALQSWLAATGRSLQTAWIRFTDATSTTLFAVGQTPVTGGDIAQALIILLIAWLLSRGVRYGIHRVSRRETVGRQASLYTISRLTHYAIIILAFFIALSSIGLDLSNLALVAGALSVGIGFGLQSIVNNFVSGLIILFERTLRVGDYIELDTGLTGTVKAINVRSTLINTNDNIDIVVPNSEFVTTRLTNWTLGERILRVRIPFGVAYGSDKELVKKAALEACEEVQYTLTHMPGREPDIWLVDYGDSSLNFLLLVWVNRQGARRPTRTRAAYLWALEDKLAEYGIEIPFPQRDLHLRSGWQPVTTDPVHDKE